MIKKNYTDNYTLTINKNISNTNIKMLKNLPAFIIRDLTIQEAHIQTIKDAITYYGFLIETFGHEYTFKELADMIKSYFELTGKNEWYYDYLTAI